MFLSGFKVSGSKEVGLEEQHVKKVNRGFTIRRLDVSSKASIANGHANMPLHITTCGGK